VDGSPIQWIGDIAEDGGWALLADGMGGHVAGEIAATLAVEVLRPLMSHIQTPEDVQRAVNLADEAIFMAMKMRPELHGMGTTIAGAVIRPRGALTFNAGDSRVYALDRGVLRQTSIDDVMRSGALLQCLGGYAEPVPMHVHTKWVDADVDILLCSDGVTDLLSDVRMAELLAETSEDPAQDIVSAALSAGGHDNASAIFLQRRNPGSCDPQLLAGNISN
jgi:protein phosphatase